MTMTPEQKQAIDAIDIAIREARDLFIESEERGTITEWLVLYASRSWDNEGEQFTAIGRIVSEPAPPIHQQLGMLHYEIVNLEDIIKKVKEDD